MQQILGFLFFYSFRPREQIVTFLKLTLELIFRLHAHRVERQPCVKRFISTNLCGSENFFSLPTKNLHENDLEITRRAREKEKIKWSDVAVQPQRSNTQFMLARLHIFPFNLKMTLFFPFKLSRCVVAKIYCTRGGGGGIVNFVTFRDLKLRVLFGVRGCKYSRILLEIED